MPTNKSGRADYALPDSTTMFKVLQALPPAKSYFFSA
jgi:hypothetical protein